MNFSEDIENCANLVRRGDYDRFLAIMSAPIKKRGALFIIFAFNLEVVRAPWVTKEPMISEMRLQWWLDSINEIYEGNTVKKHEVISPLAKLIKDQDLPKDLFINLINARRWDIYKKPHVHAFAFDDYIMATSGNLMALACLAIGMPISDLNSAKEYGYGDGVARLFVAIPILEENNRYPLVNGTENAVSSLAKTALNKMNNTKFSDNSAACALRLAWLSKGVLNKVNHNPKCVLNGDLYPSEFMKKLILLSKVILRTF